MTRERDTSQAMRMYQPSKKTITEGMLVFSRMTEKPITVEMTSVARELSGRVSDNMVRRYGKHAKIEHPVCISRISNIYTGLNESSIVGPITVDVPTILERFTQAAFIGENSLLPYITRIDTRHVMMGMCVALAVLEES